MCHCLRSWSRQRGVRLNLRRRCSCDTLLLGFDMSFDHRAKARLTCLPDELCCHIFAPKREWCAELSLV